MKKYSTQNTGAGRVSNISNKNHILESYINCIDPDLRPELRALLEQVFPSESDLLKS